MQKLRKIIEFKVSLRFLKLYIPKVTLILRLDCSSDIAWGKRGEKSVLAKHQNYLESKKIYDYLINTI